MFQEKKWVRQAISIPADIAASVVPLMEHTIILAAPTRFAQFAESNLQNAAVRLNWSGSQLLSDKLPSS